MNRPSGNGPTQKTRGAVIYTRVSTGEQDRHGTSPETQLRDCRQKALELGLPIVNEYYDPGISGGFLSSRPGMMAAVADIQAGRADTLICANMSRYSRDAEHQQALLKSIRAAGGRIVFCDMTFDDTPTGDMMFGMVGQFAQWERAEIRGRLTRGLYRRAQTGAQPGRATPPYGYHIVGHRDVIRGEYPESDLGRYVVREDQAAVVRRIYAAYHAGTHSLTALVRELNAEAVPTPGRSEMWGMTTVRYILMNTVYKGVAVYGRHDNVTDEARLQERHWRTGELLKEPRRRRPAAPETWITMPCPALVGEAVWEAVQVRLRENKARKGGNPQRVRMLTGRVFCPHCGATLTLGTTKRRDRRGNIVGKPQNYVCYAYMNSLRRDARPGGVLTPACVPTAYAGEIVERDTATAVGDAAHHPESIAEVLAVYAPEPPAPPEQARRELAAVDKALQDLASQEAAAVQAQIAGIRAGASPDAYAAVFADLAARRKDMEGRRGALSRSVREAGRGKAAAPDGAALTRQALEDAWQVLTSPKVPGAVKRDIVATVVEKVVPRREGERVITDVFFLPGVLGGTETLQTRSDGSDSTRALFSVISAVSDAASGARRFSGPPPLNGLL
ncbi:MAG: recombinase family protein [Armatimonadetes bacterium]|nr:recombinase family protein [Armatimonadota bacterium]